MKIVLILCAITTAAFAGTPVLVRITPEEFAKLHAHSPLEALEQAPVPSSESSPDESLLNHSVVIHDGSHWTIVPKGAVVFLPASLKSKVDAKPVGKLLTFKDFAAVNGSWMAVSEVTFEQAAGEQSIPSESVTQWAKQDKIVVAVHQGGPISVRVATEPTITQR